MPQQRIKAAQWCQDKVEKWTAFVNHNRKRYFKEPTALNLTIWIKTQEKLETMEYLCRIKDTALEEQWLLEWHIQNLEMWYTEDRSEELLTELLFWYEKLDRFNKDNT